MREIAFRSQGAMALLGEFAKALGCGGGIRSWRSMIYRYESGEHEIPKPAARLGVMFDRFGMPKEYL